MGKIRFRKIYTICICIITSAIALISSFTMKREITETKVTTSNDVLQATYSIDPTSMEIENNSDLSQESIEPEAEFYQEEGEVIVVYFTNTEEIDTGMVLPMEAQVNLTKATQSFLLSQGIMPGEVRVSEGTVIQTDLDVSFNCSLPEYMDQILEVKYINTNKEFSFKLNK